METWPDCAPAIRASSTPVTSRSAATACSTRLAGPKSCPFRPRNVPSCQVCPKRAGLAAASDTPAEKVKAASTPSTPTTAPTRAGRTGTAERPRPGSSAKRAPTTTGKGSPAPATATATADRRGMPCRRPAVSAAAAAAADPASTSSGKMAHPVPSTSQSTSSPGCGSTIDARPIGIHREATTAPATPAVVPAAPARKGAADAAATACRGVMPTARKTCRSATVRSEEHTSELQSRVELVCRLLLEKKKKKQERHIFIQEGQRKHKYITNKDCN